MCILCFSFPEEGSLASKLGLPPDDFTLLQQKGVYFQPVPIYLYLTSYALVELFSVVAHLPIAMLGTITSKICGGWVVIVTLINHVIIFSAIVSRNESLMFVDGPTQICAFEFW